jgi:hypothetical protein
MAQLQRGVALSEAGPMPTGVQSALRGLGRHGLRGYRLGGGASATLPGRWRVGSQRPMLCRPTMAAWAARM